MDDTAEALADDLIDSIVAAMLARNRVGHAGICNGVIWTAKPRF